MHVPNNRDSKYMKQKAIDPKGNKPKKQIHNHSRDV